MSIHLFTCLLVKFDVEVFRTKTLSLRSEVSHHGRENGNFVLFSPTKTKIVPQMYNEYTNILGDIRKKK